MKKLLSLLILTQFLAAPLWAHEDRGQREQREGRREHMEKQWEELQLTAQQKQQMKAIRQRYKKQLQAKRDAIHQAHEVLQNGLRSDRDDGSVKQSQATLQKLHNELGDLRFKQTLEIRALLTPEQRQKFRGFGPIDRPGPEKDADE